MEVTKERWDTLSQEERDLAKAIGITLTFKTTKIGHKSKSEPDLDPEPYIVQTKILCSLCKSKTTQFFHMKLEVNSQNPRPYLLSEQVTEQQATELKLPYKSQRIRSSTCSACIGVLQKWTREDLITKLIKEASNAKVRY